MKRLSFPRDIFWGRAEGSKGEDECAKSESKEEGSGSRRAWNNVKTGPGRKVTGAYYF